MWCVQILSRLCGDRGKEWMMEDMWGGRGFEKINFVMLMVVE